MITLAILSGLSGQAAPGIQFAGHLAGWLMLLVPLFLVVVALVLGFRHRRRNPGPARKRLFPRSMRGEMLATPKSSETPAFSDQTTLFLPNFPAIQAQPAAAKIPHRRRACANCDQRGPISYCTWNDSRGMQRGSLCEKCKKQLNAHTYDTPTEIVLPMRRAR